MANSMSDYVANFRANLPSGITFNSTTSRYFANGKPFYSEWVAERYKNYVTKTGTISQQLLDLRTFMETADTYIVSGDSTRDTAYNEMQNYYVRMFNKASITAVDNSASGVSGQEWAENTASVGVTDCIAAISGTGSTTVVEWSFGINDITDGTEDVQTIAALWTSGLDALIAAKPDVKLFFVQPTAVFVAARNDKLNEIYEYLGGLYNAHVVEAYQPMRDVYDGVTDNIFYFDSTHPNETGSVRLANIILSDILPDSLLPTILLDNGHWTGSVDSVLTTQTTVAESYWNSSGGRSVNASWKSFDRVDVVAGQKLRITHSGSRDDVRLLDIGEAIVDTLTTPDTGSAPGIYTYNIVNGSVAYAGCNITSTSQAAGAGAKVEVLETVPQQEVGDLTQAEINVGLTNMRLTA